MFCYFVQKYRCVISVVIRIETYNYLALPIFLILLSLFHFIYENTDKKESIVELIASHVLKKTISTLYNFM
jgi:hypothetical protein